MASRVFALVGAPRVLTRAVAREVLILVGVPKVLTRAVAQEVLLLVGAPRVLTRAVAPEVLIPVAARKILVPVVLTMPVFAGTVKQSDLYFGLMVLSFQVEVSRSQCLFSDPRGVFPLLSFSRTALVIPYVQHLARFLFTNCSLLVKKNCVFFKGEIDAQKE